MYRSLYRAVGSDLKRMFLWGTLMLLVIIALFPCQLSADSSESLINKRSAPILIHSIVVRESLSRLSIDLEDATAQYGLLQHPARNFVPGTIISMIPALATV